MPDLHELLEDRLQLAVRDVAVIDVQRQEVATVHEVAQTRIGTAVSALRIRRQFYDDVNALRDLPKVGLQSLSQLFNAGPLAAQPPLLVMEQIGADAVVVVGVQQLALLRLDAHQRALSILAILLTDL